MGDRDEQLIGPVCQRDERTSPQQRRTMTVRDAMKPAAQLGVARPGGDALEVLKVLAERDINQVPVIENGRIVGLRRRADILRWLALHGHAPQARGRTA